MRLSSKQATNLNYIFSVLTSHSQDDVIPEMQITIENDEATVYINAPYISTDALVELEEIGFCVLYEVDYYSIDF
jgi:hypothetical protein